jgi:hypothetical protein
MYVRIADCIRQDHYNPMIIVVYTAKRELYTYVHTTVKGYVAQVFRMPFMQLLFRRIFGDIHMRGEQLQLDCFHRCTVQL